MLTTGPVASSLVSVVWGLLEGSCSWVDFGCLEGFLHMGGSVESSGFGEVQRGECLHGSMGVYDPQGSCC